MAELSAVFPIVYKPYYIDKKKAHIYVPFN